MSSRSLQQARARRAGENPPPVSGNRPITSIGSQAAFAQQMPPNMGYNMPPPPNNVRIARAQAPNQPNQQPPQQYQQQNQYQQNYNPNQKQMNSNNQTMNPNNSNPNSLPFTKLSISDAIGLITLRLGRVEQWIIDTDQENEDGKADIPDGCKMIDNSVLTTIINRLDALEKNGGSSEEISSAIKSLTDQCKRIGDDVSKHTIEIAKNTEQVFRFNRELTETKDLLKSFMMKYDMFAQETAQNFADYDVAFADLEKRLPESDMYLTNETILSTVNETQEQEQELVGTSIHDIDVTDLKSIVQQELGSI